MLTHDCRAASTGVGVLQMQAISAWRDNSGFGRVQLVKQYFLVEGERTRHAWSTESMNVLHAPMGASM